MSAPVPFDPVARLASALSLPPASVKAVVSLLADGNTVPFIARYRKEATQGLDEVQIRDIESLGAQFAEIEARRAAILAAIEKQGQLTPQLKAQIESAKDKSRLEDLYLPYKKKRKTRASVAKERGLEPLAESLLSPPSAGRPEDAAAAYVNANKDVPDVEAALAGARDIVAERVSEHAGVRADARRVLFTQGVLAVKATKKGKAETSGTYDTYHEHSEALRRVAPHRYQAIRRGEAEGMLRAKLELDPQDVLPDIERRFGVRGGGPWAGQLRQAVQDAWGRLLLPSLDNELRGVLKTRADEAAVEVFAQNLGAVLMSAPMGPRPVFGIDPGLRTGSKCAVLSETGRLLTYETLFLSQSEQAASKAQATLLRLIKAHPPAAIAVGNGTGGRETESFVKKTLSEAGLRDIAVVSVNEAGASVYSASDVARLELPDVDLTIRGAVSIGRRLQDPLAELVKVDPKSLGIGQYQHDVPPAQLSKKLSVVVETCVNQVGVELNTASPSLLAHVAGIGDKIAQRIVQRRDSEGAFEARRELLKVSGLGKRAFEQAAGFLRIQGAKHPLDASAVHPERYKLVEGMAKDLKMPLADLIGNREAIRRIDVTKYVSADVGEPTLKDILQELEKPGRDPREEFAPPRFREDVNTIEDLKEGMHLEGVVTNVVAFGAFVDIGVHQDGLVHISELADRFVSSPSDVVKAGDRIRVRVLSVDRQRRRIALSAKSGAS